MISLKILNSDVAIYRHQYTVISGGERNAYRDDEKQLHERECEEVSLNIELARHSWRN